MWNVHAYKYGMFKYGIFAFHNVYAYKYGMHTHIYEHKNLHIYNIPYLNIPYLYACTFHIYTLWNAYTYTLWNAYTYIHYGMHTHIYEHENLRVAYIIYRVAKTHRIP